LSTESITRHWRITALLLSLCSAPVVLACPTGQSEVCLVNCFCVPGSRDEIDGIAQSVRQFTARGLASWLVQSHANAAAGETQPIPLNIRLQLEPFYSLQVLDSARYKVGDEVELNTANTMLHNPDVNAVTMLDIIVFRHTDDALNNVELWAHELKHVQQYLELGVDEFASRYTRDYRLIEAPAYQIEAQVRRALQVSKGPTAPTQ
jgi:hypothetical protein